MTWEIAVGLFTLLAAFISVMNIVVKINSTMTALNTAVRQLEECMERQSDKNAHFYEELSEHESRLACLEIQANTERKSD